MAGLAPRRMISVFVLAMLNVSIMASLRNLPLVAEFGLSSLFFFVVVGLCFLVPSALISAELATGWPKDGGVYIWIREALGDRWGFFAIWMQWIHNVAWYPVIMSFVATTLAYVVDPTLIGNKHFVFTVVLVGFWGMTILNYLGMKTSSWFSTIGVMLGTIAPGLFIITLGFVWLGNGNPSQIAFSFEKLLPNLHDFQNLSFLAGLFLAFAGLEVSGAYAANVQNPQKNYPRAIILAALITFLLFMLGSLSIAIVTPVNEISLVGGLMEAFKAFLQHYQLTWLLPLMGALLIIGAIAEVNSWIIGPVKGLHATAIHGNLPPIFQVVNKHGTPTRLLFFQAAIVTATSLLFLYVPTVNHAFWMLTALSAQSYLLMYILLFIAAVVLRYRKPHVPRVYRVPFEAPGIWFFAALGILASLFAIAIGFIPPKELALQGSHFFYYAVLVVGLTIMCTIPLIIHQLRKPYWMMKK